MGQPNMYRVLSLLQVLGSPVLVYYLEVQCGSTQYVQSAVSAAGPSPVLVYNLEDQ